MNPATHRLTDLLTGAERPRSAFSLIIWAALGLLIVLAGALDEALPNANWLHASPWIIGLVLFTMPHGGFDWALIRRAHTDARGQASTSRVARTAAWYTLTMAAVGGAYFVLPTIMTVGFLALTVHHFGTSDSFQHAPRLGADRLRNVERWARGLLLLGGAFLASPERSLLPFETLALLSLPGQLWIDANTAQAAGACAVGVGVALLVSGVVRTRVEAGPSRAFREAALGAATLALALVADPVFAIGLYLFVVHAPGHALRNPLLTGKPPIEKLIRMHTGGIAFLVPASLAVVALAFWLGGPAEPMAWVSAFIGVCLAATLPHHLLWAGRWRGIERHQLTPA